MGIATGEVKHPIINGQWNKTNGQGGAREYLHLMELLHSREYSADGICSANERFDRGTIFDQGTIFDRGTTVGLGTTFNRGTTFDRGTTVGRGTTFD